MPANQFPAAEENYAWSDDLFTGRSKSECKRIKRWEIIGDPAYGTFSCVHRAKPAKREAEASYAIKVLREEWANSELGRSLMLKEWEVSSSVSHRHLIPVLDHCFSGEPFILAYPWLEGKTLGDFLAQGYCFSPNCAVWIARQITEALIALEDSGWIHNDIQPANIIISPQGHVTLIDLGFALRSGAGGAILDRSLSGTLCYISPEKLLGDLPIDIRSDLFSLGVVLYGMLTGETPFNVASLEQLAEHYRYAKGNLFAKLPDSVPEQIAVLLRQMTAMDYRHRPENAKSALRKIVELEIQLLY